MHKLMERNRARRAPREDTNAADSPACADPRDDAVEQSAPRTPRWVKVSAILALIAVVVVVVMLVAGGGQHGPGRHASDGGPQQQQGGQTPGGMGEVQTPSDGGAGGHVSPPGGHA